MPSRRYSPADLALLRSNPGAVLPAPKRRSQEESLMQRALIRWWKDNCHLFGVPECLLFSIPNGGHRFAVTASIMKAEGARKGAPDLVLAVSRPVFLQAHEVLSPFREFKIAHGLFLELKTRTGIVSAEQTAFHEALRSQGYKVEICRELQDAINQIISYLT